MHINGKLLFILKLFYNFLNILHTNKLVNHFNRLYINVFYSESSVKLEGIYTILRTRAFFLSSRYFINTNSILFRLLQSPGGPVVLLVVLFTFNASGYGRHLISNPSHHRLCLAQRKCLIIFLIFML